MFDTRGHTIFTEDGTERFNIIRYNLVGVVRPIWSLLMVDQSPSNFWIVNPHNYVYGNVAAGSSHYGFWFRSLPEPDGVSGQGLADSALNRCPNYAELLKFEVNVAHSTGKHGLKVSNYFPLVGGYLCPAEEISAPRHTGETRSPPPAPPLPLTFGDEGGEREDGNNGLLEEMRGRRFASFSIV